MSGNRYYAAAHTAGFASWAYAERDLGYAAISLSRAEAFLRETLHDETSTVTIADAE